MTWRQIAAAGVVLAAMYTVAAEIRLPAQSDPTIAHAVADLAHYLELATGESVPVSAADGTNGAASQADGELLFLLRVSGEGKPEGWRIRSVEGGVEISGADSTGLLYGVYHYLEDVLGVRWWNAESESVPRVSMLPWENLALAGAPAFAGRNIYSLYGSDRGLFASRLRLNGNGDSPIAPEYGGRKEMGPPYHVHTFAMYLPPERYFAAHPEWYAEVDGVRLNLPGNHVGGAQLCLSNPQMRHEFTRLLLENIAAEEQLAAQELRPPAKIYDVSQNDNQRYCRCTGCTVLAQQTGGQSGVLLDFINELAREVGARYPGVFVNTLAYQYTEGVPKALKLELNVMITLCDTASNAIRPLTASGNEYFQDKLRAWAVIAPQLRVWDYAVTYGNATGLPYPGEFAYAADLRLLAEVGVRYLFTEMEFPVLADARDMKVWVLAHLMENPALDPEALMQEFATGFYGAAAPEFLAWRQLLRDETERRKSHIGMFPSPGAFGFLSGEVLAAGHTYFERGLPLVKDDPVLARRWRHARLPLERATLICRRKLMREYLEKHGSLEGYPYVEKAMAESIRTTWNEESSRLSPRELPAARKKLEAELAEAVIPVAPGLLRRPERFAAVAEENCFDYTCDNFERWDGVVELVEDPEAESGWAARLAFPNRGGEEHRLEKYRLPQIWGIYSASLRRNLSSGRLTPEMVPGAGYHWYELGEVKLSEDALLFLFWSWFIKVNVGGAFDPNDLNVRYRLWVCARFTGPDFPHGTPDEANAIFVERIVMEKIAVVSSR